ncbi:MAG: pro-sigmaK processing inhibitor BofA [Firmicutes bacterium]|nr:pro-sigmaK processing inhibitor BofA [Bacillota bacterium]
MPPLGLNHILAFFFGLLVLYLVAKLLYFPLKVMLRLLGNAVIGGLLLLIFNAVGGFWGLTIGINVITALVVGILGIPGIILLIILKSIT